MAVEPGIEPSQSCFKILLKNDLANLELQGEHDDHCATRPVVVIVLL